MKKIFNNVDFLIYQQLYQEEDLSNEFSENLDIIAKSMKKDLKILYNN